MPAIISSLLSLVNVAAILLMASTIGQPQVANAISVHLFAESGCPATNPGPVCTNIPELTCCKDHVGDIAYYYTSAFFEGLRETDHAISAWTYNVDSTCGRISAVNYYNRECFDTNNAYKDGYGAYWAIVSYGQEIPLPTVRAFVNGSASGGALTGSLPECKGSVAPDVYHIKLSANSPSIPVARKTLQMMLSVGDIERATDALQVGEFVDRETGVVKGEKLAIVQETLEKYGDGLTDAQIQALKRLWK